MRLTYLPLCAFLLSACTVERFPIELTLEVEADGQLQQITRNTTCATKPLSHVWDQHSRLVHPLPDGGYLLFSTSEWYCNRLLNGNQVYRSEANSFMDIGWTDDFLDPKRLVWLGSSPEYASHPARVDMSTLSFSARRATANVPHSPELANDDLVKWFGLAHDWDDTGRPEQILHGGSAIVMPRALWDSVDGARQFLSTYDTLAAIPQSSPISRAFLALRTDFLHDRRGGSVDLWNGSDQFALRHLANNSWTIDQTKPGRMVFVYVDHTPTLTADFEPSPKFEGVELSGSNVLYDPSLDVVLVITLVNIIARRGS